MTRKLNLIRAALLLSVMFSGCSKAPEEFLELARRQAQEGKTNDAVISYRRAIQGDTAQAAAYVELHELLVKQGKAQEAFTVIRAGAGRLPQEESVHGIYFETLFAMVAADPEIATSPYQELESKSAALLASNPKSFAALRARGQLASLNRRPEEALDYYGKANELNPLEPNLILAYSQELARAGRGAEGEALAKSLIGKEPGFAAIYDSLYSVYLSTGRYQDAEAIIKLKSANNPGEAAYVIELADHYARARNFEPMRQALQTLLDREKEFPLVYVYVGDFYGDRGNWPEALKYYDLGATKGGEGGATAAKHKVRALVALNRRAEAEKLLESLEAADPKDADVRVAKAGLLLDTGDAQRLDEAVGILQAVVAERPNHSGAQFILGSALMRKGDSRTALSAFHAAGKASPNSMRVMTAIAEAEAASGRWQSVLEITDAMLARDQASVAARSLRVRGLAATGRLAEARTLLNQVLREAPGFVPAQIDHAFLLLGEKKFPEAEAVFRKLHKPGQADLRPLQGLAASFAARQQFDRAIGVFEQELKAAGPRDDVQLGLAATYAQAGRLDQALANYQAMLDRKPDNPDVLYRTAQIHMARQEFPRAIERLETMIKLAPDQAGPVSLLAVAQMQADKKAEAVASFRTVLKSHPEDPHALHNLAYLLADTGGDLREAFNLAEKAVARDKNSPRTAETLGFVYLKQKKTDEALQILERVVAQNPDRASARYHLGLALIAKGDRAKARGEFQSALGKNPSPRDAGRIKQALQGL
jgi:tetratricopeptide (TPR) repeat protein